LAAGNHVFAPLSQQWPQTASALPAGILFGQDCWGSSPIDFQKESHVKNLVVSVVIKERERNLQFRFKAAIVALALVLLAPTFSNAAELSGCSNHLDLHALFRTVGAMYGLDPELLEAVAEVESSGRSDAVSPKGAIGLMQLMPSTAARYRVRDPRDPVENALGAARYLVHLKDTMAPPGDEADLSRILAGYNAGEGAVSRYDGLPPYAETQEYVGRVLWVYLLGSSPPQGASRHRPASHHKVVGTSSKPSDSGRYGDRAMLDELDSLRRARASADDPEIQTRKTLSNALNSIAP
jgi:soluble lytic murein transglycosylase-like protein